MKGQEEIPREAHTHHPLYGDKYALDQTVFRAVGDDLFPLSVYLSPRYRVNSNIVSL